MIDRIAALERRVSEAERIRVEQRSQSDLSHHAEMAALITHLRRLESALEDARERSKDAIALAHESKARWALHEIAKLALNAIAVAIGAYLAVRGIGL
jgi:long-subunit acyl-CoA synthetase (AMP-forming)